MITIKNVLDKFDEKSKEQNSWLHQNGSITYTTGMTVGETRKFLQDNLALMLESIEKELPKERGLDKESGCRGAENRRYNKGWNKCRQEVLNIINSHR